MHGAGARRGRGGEREGEGSARVVAEHHLAHAAQRAVREPAGLLILCCDATTQKKSMLARRTCLYLYSTIYYGKR